MIKAAIKLGFQTLYFTEHTFDWMKQKFYNEAPAHNQACMVPLHRLDKGAFVATRFSTPFTPSLKDKLEDTRKTFIAINGLNRVVENEEQTESPNYRKPGQEEEREGQIGPSAEEPTEQPEERFWMVYLSGGGAPTFRHESEAAAKLEAARLSRNLSRPAYVLEAKARVVVEVKATTHVDVLSSPPKPETETNPIHQGFYDYQD